MFDNLLILCGFAFDYCRIRVGYLIQIKNRNCNSLTYVNLALTKLVKFLQSSNVSYVEKCYSFLSALAYSISGNIFDLSTHVFLFSKSSLRKRPCAIFQSCFVNFFLFETLKSVFRKSPINLCTD